MLTETSLEIQNIFKNEPDYAWTLLQAQIELQMQPIVSGQQISKLLELYMKGVQKMNSVSDLRQGYFKGKVTSLMTKQTVIKSLKENPMKKKKKKYDEQEQAGRRDSTKVQPFENDRGKHLQTEKQQKSADRQKLRQQRQLRQRQKQIEMRMAHTLQENNDQNNLKRLIEQENSRETKLTQNIQNQLSDHERRLQERIQNRKLRTTTFRSKKSQSILNQESETQPSTLKLGLATNNKKEQFFNPSVVILEQQKRQKENSRAHSFTGKKHQHNRNSYQECFVTKDSSFSEIIVRTRTKSLDIGTRGNTEGPTAIEKVLIHIFYINTSTNLNHQGAMNESDKKIFIDNFQKTIARKCYPICTKPQNPQLDQQCLTTCYQKYLRTIETVNQSIRSLAYENNSIVGYKAYPQHQIQMQHYYNDDIFTNFGPYAFARKWKTSV